jgi:hypothetical protein
LCIIKVNKRKLKPNTNHVPLHSELIYQWHHKAVVIDPGINKPASVAVNPKWIAYMGIINVDPYNPKPRIKAIKYQSLNFHLSERLNLLWDIYRSTDAK